MLNACRTPYDLAFAKRRLLLAHIVRDLQYEGAPVHEVVGHVQRRILKQRVVRRRSFHRRIGGNDTHIRACHCRIRRPIVGGVARREIDEAHAPRLVAFQPGLNLLGDHHLLNLFFGASMKRRWRIDSRRPVRLGRIERNVEVY